MTHYERLGVVPTALRPEVRAAYRQAARHAHPDRNGDASATVMAAVNEAWRVLGDSDRRQRYDAELANRGMPAGAPATAPWECRPDAAPEASERAVAAAYGPARIPWRFMLGMAFAGVLIVVIGHALAGPSPPVRPDGILTPADCVMLPGNFEAVEVSCAGAHDAVVQALIPSDQTCPASTETYRDRQGLGNACVVRRVP